MGSISAVSIDTEGALRTWLNTLTSSLVGNGQPMPAGVFLEDQRSPAKGARGVISRIGGSDALGPEDPADLARMSCAITSTTRLSAAAAAGAYANALRTLSVVQPVMTAYGCVIRLASNISGPVYIPNATKALPQYLVDADVYFLSL